MKRHIITAVSILFAVAAFGEITGEHPVSTPVYAPATAVSGQIASDGDGFFEVWEDQRDHGAVYASAVTRNGTVLNPSGILLSKKPSVFAVVWTGESYLAVWNDSNNVVAEQFAADGRVVAPTRAIVANEQVTEKHALSTNGKITVLTCWNRYFVLDRNANVIDSASFGALSVYVTGTGEFVITGGGVMRIDSSGRFATRSTHAWPNPIACRASGCITVFQDVNTHGHIAVGTYDPATLAIGTVLETPLQLPAAQVWLDLLVTEDGYVLATGNGMVQRLGPDGHPVGAPVMLTGGSGQVTAATNGRDVAVLRTVGSRLINDIVTAGSSTQYTVGISANAQHEVAIARSASNYLAVWTERDGVYAGRLSLDGLPLDGRGTLLSTDTRKPSVVYDGSSYLIVAGHAQLSSATTSQTVFQIDPATGALLSQLTIPGSMQIATNGTTRVGVWVDSAGGLEAAFLAPNGAISSFPALVALPLRFGGASIGNPSLAWNGAIWLVTWMDQVLQGILLEGHQPDPVDIRCERLSAALIPLDAEPVMVTAPSDWLIQSSRISSDGHDFLVAWNAQPFPGLRVRRVLSTGVAEGAAISLFNGLLQDLVWDGAEYDLAFNTEVTYLAPVDEAIVRLLPSGRPLETLVISAAAGDERSASLVPIGNGRILAAYTRVAFEPLYAGVERAFVGTPRPARGRATFKGTQ